MMMLPKALAAASLTSGARYSPTLTMKGMLSFLPVRSASECLSREFLNRMNRL